MRRLLIGVIGASVVLWIATYAFFGYYRLQRWRAIAGYGNALDYCYLRSAPIPADLAVLEAQYNRYERRKAQLPSPPWFLRPTFRPPGKSSDRLYLTIIESKPPWVSDSTRWVIYCNANGSRLSIANLDERKFAELLQQDDAQRRTEVDRPALQPDP